MHVLHLGSAPPPPGPSRRRHSASITRSTAALHTQGATCCSAQGRRDHIIDSPPARRRVTISLPCPKLAPPRRPGARLWSSSMGPRRPSAHLWRTGLALGVVHEIIVIWKLYDVRLVGLSHWAVQIGTVVASPWHHCHLFHSFSTLAGLGIPSLWLTDALESVWEVDDLAIIPFRLFYGFLMSGVELTEE